MRRLALAVALLLGAAACAKGQDPGIEGPTGTRPSGGPQFVPECAPADAPTTTAGACVDDEGNIRR